MSNTNNDLYEIKITTVNGAVNVSEKKTFSIEPKSISNSEYCSQGNKLIIVSLIFFIIGVIIGIFATPFL